VDFFIPASCGKVRCVPLFQTDHDVSNHRSRVSLKFRLPLERRDLTKIVQKKSLKSVQFIEKTQNSRKKNLAFRLHETNLLSQLGPSIQTGPVFASAEPPRPDLIVSRSSPAPAAAAPIHLDGS
jgi:hypothetical protein